MRKTEPIAIDLPEDVVLSVRGVSKKFCRNLRRSMWYGIQDLSRNLVGLRSNPETEDGRLKTHASPLATQGTATDFLGGEASGSVDAEQGLQSDSKGLQSSVFSLQSDSVEWGDLGLKRREIDALFEAIVDFAAAPVGAYAWNASLSWQEFSLWTSTR